MAAEIRCNDELRMRNHHQHEHMYAETAVNPYFRFQDFHRIYIIFIEKCDIHAYYLHLSPKI